MGKIAVSSVKEIKQCNMFEGGWTEVVVKGLWRTTSLRRGHLRWNQIGERGWEFGTEEIAKAETVGWERVWHISGREKTPLGQEPHDQVYILTLVIPEFLHGKNLKVVRCLQGELFGGRWGGLVGVGRWEVPWSCIPLHKVEKTSTVSTKGCGEGAGLVMITGWLKCLKLNSLSSPGITTVFFKISVSIV